jgi:NAD(P)-dependent dehydrogenase (short-subunit alcohol dehydrogenase family)
MTSPLPAIYPSLVGRTVLVSGGASGIGEAIVRAFASQKAKVGFLDLQKREGENLAAELIEEGAEVRFALADVTDTEAFKAEIADIESTLGPVGVLFNNSANDTRHDWRGETPESFDARLAVNLKHQFFAIQAVAPQMIEAGGGSIINFGSISWRIGMGGMPGYTASKAAIEALTKSFARDLGPHRIRVNCVLPGWIMTRRQIELWFDENAERTLKDRQCLPDKIQPEDVARLVLFLASDESRMCTSQNFVIDGGWL